MILPVSISLCQCVQSAPWLCLCLLSGLFCVVVLKMLIWFIICPKGLVLTFFIMESENPGFGVTEKCSHILLVTLI